VVVAPHVFTLGLCVLLICGFSQEHAPFPQDSTHVGLNNNLSIDTPHNKHSLNYTALHCYLFWNVWEMIDGIFVCIVAPG